MPISRFVGESVTAETAAGTVTIDQCVITPRGGKSEMGDTGQYWTTDHLTILTLDVENGRKVRSGNTVYVRGIAALVEGTPYEHVSFFATGRRGLQIDLKVRELSGSNPPDNPDIPGEPETPPDEDTPVTYYADKDGKVYITGTNEPFMRAGKHYAHEALALLTGLTIDPVYSIWVDSDGVEVTDDFGDEIKVL